MAQSFRLSLLLACVTVGAVVAWLKTAAPQDEPGGAAPSPIRGAQSPRPSRATNDEAALQSLAARLSERGRKKQSADLEASCSEGQEPCDCRASMLRAALDLGEVALTEVLLGRSAPCPADRGARAEWLSLQGLFEEAKTLGRSVPKGRPGYPEAQLGLGRAELRTGHEERAVGHLEQAVASGRGTGAQLLLVQLALRAGDRARARRIWEQMRAGHPDALYARALLFQFDDEYGEARSSHLRTLAVDPMYASARFQLGLLTHSVGATQEARHNLERLEAIVGSQDGRVASLRAVLAGPPAPLQRRFVFSDAGAIPEPPEGQDGSSETTTTSSP